MMMDSPRSTPTFSTTFWRAIHLHVRRKNAYLNRLLLILALSFLYDPAVASDAQEKKVVNSLGMEFVLIPAGTFIMGSPIDEVHRGASEVQHQVTITRPFYMQTTEVTVDEWRAVMGRRFFARKKGAGDMPVVKVSWHDCKKFIRKLNLMTGDLYALPTEAQWEYAARAGTETAYFWGGQIDCTRAMFANNAKKYNACVSANRSSTLDPDGPAPVKRYAPNAWGLFDMHGNVYEFCQDFYDYPDAYYSQSPELDPEGPPDGEYRIMRGGSWGATEKYCTSGSRNYMSPSKGSSSIGFRLLREE